MFVCSECLCDLCGDCERLLDRGLERDRLRLRERERDLNTYREREREGERERERVNKRGHVYRCHSRTFFSWEEGNGRTTVTWIWNETCPYSHRNAGHTVMVPPSPAHSPRSSWRRSSQWSIAVALGSVLGLKEVQERSCLPALPGRRLTL